MFDWNDEELGNIIWDVAGESGGDHIVPYQDRSGDYCNKRQRSQETANKRQNEQNTLGFKIDIHGKKLGSCSNFRNSEGIASRFSIDSSPDLSISNTKTGITQFHKDSEVFQNSYEGNEQGDFVDDSWANIGSFDDLDRIFSNDDPIFGLASLCYTNELWSSSRHVTNSPEKSFSIASEEEQIQLEDESFTHGSWRDHESYDLQNAHAMLDDEEYDRGESKPIVKKTDVDMVENTTSANPCQFVKVKDEGKLPRSLYRSWSPPRKSLSQFKSQSEPSMVQSFPPSLASKKRLHGHLSFQYQQASNPFIFPSAYGGLTNIYPVMHGQSHLPGELKHQPFPSGFEIYHGNVNPLVKSTDTSVKQLIMTPREKIEKLRRRQQMQATLAIQKQQRQFRHQVPCEDHSVTQQCPRKNQFQCFEGADLEVENPSSVPSLDSASPIEQDYANTTYVAVDSHSMDGTILYRLQDTIAKLDIRTRLRIRDSLLRLAQSVKRRHFARDTNSTNKSSEEEHEVITNQDFNICDRNASMPDVETETNPIDRIVAHLLYMKPLEFSLHMPQHVDQFRISSSIDTSQNASYKELADGRAFDIEASQ